MDLQVYQGTILGKKIDQRLTFVIVVSLNNMKPESKSKFVKIEHIYHKSIKKSLIDFHIDTCNYVRIKDRSKGKIEKRKNMLLLHCKITGNSWELSESAGRPANH